MKRSSRDIICGLAFLLAAETVSALSSYQSRVPNGTVNSCSTCHDTSGPPALNPFGDDFLAASLTWGPALAKMDSDGDGFTNGQELGDPQGVWTPGAALPIPGAQVTLPGFPNSFPQLRPPNIAITSPATGAAFSPPFTGPITASSTNPAAAITAVQFFSGATLLGTDTSSPYSQAVNLPTGSYTLTARAIDYLGASNTSAAVSITVNAAAVAPTIVTQPASQVVTAGANVTFSAVATGTPPLSYQWRKNTVNIGGATGTSFALAGVTAADAGTYSVVVTNVAGSATSAGATLTVNPAPVGPAITTQPVSQIVTAGANVAFTVAASGTAPLSYQWRRNAVNIGGATGTSLTLNGVTAADAGTYSTVVTNVAGSATSAGATLTVNVLPQITTQPASQTVVAGANVTFTVAATGTAPLSYQWRKNLVNIGGATGTSLALNGVTAADGGTYSAVVTNIAGSATSAGAVLTVNPAAVAPVITLQPASQTVTAGDNVTFTVAASGTAPLSYQWRKNTANIGGATGTSLTLNGVTATDGGTYSAVVTNTAGSATSAGAVLTVNPIVISISITSPTNGASFNEPATFALIASATPTGSVARVEFFQNATSVGSVTTPPYLFNVINLGAGTYTYTARATDKSGATVTSAGVGVTVIGGPPPSGPAVVTVTATDPNADEAGPDPGMFQVARTGATTSALTVFYLLGGTAVNGQDYQMLSNAVTIAAGSATADITVMPIPDVDTPTEVSDTVILQLTAPPVGAPGYTIGSPSNAVVTIIERTNANLAPVVTMIAPRNGATFRAGGNIMLAASASDPDGTVTQVEFFAGTMSLGFGVPLTGHDDDNYEHDGEHSGGRTGVYVFTWRNVPSGQYRLAAVATDNLGATTASAPVNITVRRFRFGDD